MTHDEFLKKFEELLDKVSSPSDEFKGPKQLLPYIKEAIACYIGDEIPYAAISIPIPTPAILIASLFLGCAKLFIGGAFEDYKRATLLIVRQRMNEYSSDRPLGNLLKAGELLEGYVKHKLGVGNILYLPVFACLVRLTDKYARLENLLSSDGCDTDQVRDTCIDGCAYALFLPILEEICREGGEENDAHQTH